MCLQNMRESQERTLSTPKKRSHHQRQVFDNAGKVIKNKLNILLHNPLFPVYIEVPRTIFY